jgi:hypothetical protein
MHLSPSAQRDAIDLLGPKRFGHYVGTDGVPERKAQ